MICLIIFKKINFTKIIRLSQIETSKQQKGKYKFLLFYTSKHLSMQSTQTFLHHTFYPLSPQQDQVPLISNKTTWNYPRKLKTQSIEPYHSLKFKNYEHLEKFPNSNQIQKKNSQKHCIVKPLKNKTNNLPIKAKTQNIQNYTTNQTSINHFPNLVIKRSGSTAPIRNRTNSDTNKQNHPNQEQKITPENQQKKPPESVSSIFHLKNKSKHLKLSSLIRFKSKPHIIFCSSKLPKDFFEDSLEEDHHGHEYKFLPVNLNSINHHSSFKNLKYTSSVKLLRRSKMHKMLKNFVLIEEDLCKNKESILKLSQNSLFGNRRVGNSLKFQKKTNPFKLQIFKTLSNQLLQ